MSADSAAPDIDRLQAIVSRFGECRVLVLGDIILDRYWWGDASRLSPEAPVPLVRKRTATARPGGAGNVAANVASLGATVELIGVIGNDPAAAELNRELELAGVDAAYLLRSPTRPTTTKTRVVAFHQHIVRVDDEDTSPISEAESDQVLSRVSSAIRDIDVILISDYAKGFLTPFLLKEVIRMSRSQDKRVFVDPKGSDYSRYRGATLLKPNRLELSALTGVPVHDHKDTLHAGNLLLSALGDAMIVVTEGEDGMTLFRPSLPVERVCLPPQHVYDVTGAGDTVMATLALSVLADATLREAMLLSSQAAAVAIGTVGTFAVTAKALLEALEPGSDVKAGVRPN